jgi:hypothetical protein
VDELSAESRFDAGRDWPTDAEVCLDLLGGVDDHLRAVAILAELFSQAPGVDVDAVRTCKDPKAGWKERLAAFKMAASISLGKPIFVRDPDALVGDHWSCLGSPPEEAPTESDEDGVSCGHSPVEDAVSDERWADHSMRTQRRELLETLLDIGARPGNGEWRFLRTGRRQSVTEAMRDRGIPVLSTLEDADPEPILVLLAELDPVVRPIARSLLADEVVEESDLRRMLQDTQAPEVDVIDAAIDTLRSPVRRTLRTLVCSRVGMPVNGKASPFPWRGGDAAEFPADPVDKEHFNDLVKRNLVIRNQSSWRVPRQVRARVLPLAKALDHEGMRSIHRWLVGEMAAESPEQLAEKHYHAVESEDIDLAVAWSKSYSADLRAIGYALSRRASAMRNGKAQRALFGQAAKVYQRLVDDFDKRDAYAWEYLAYNLARSGAEPKNTLAAYEKASDLDPTNPLYRGRYVGYSAELGEDIMAVFGKYLAQFRETWDESGGWYFAEPALRGIRRAKKGDLLAAIRCRYGEVLQQSSPRMARLLEDL